MSSSRRRTCRTRPSRRWTRSTRSSTAATSRSWWAQTTSRTRPRGGPATRSPGCRSSTWTTRSRSSASSGPWAAATPASTTSSTATPRRACSSPMRRTAWASWWRPSRRSEPLSVATLVRGPGGDAGAARSRGAPPERVRSAAVVRIASTPRPPRPGSPQRSGGPHEGDPDPLVDPPLGLVAGDTDRAHLPGVRDVGAAVGLEVKAHDLDRPDLLDAVRQEVHLRPDQVRDREGFFAREHVDADVAGTEELLVDRRLDRADELAGH